MTDAGPPRRALAGVAVAAWWPDAPGSYGEDAAAVAPPGARGAAVVAAGHGAIGAQGRPAAHLALWSVLGELAAGDDRGAGAGDGDRARLGPAGDVAARLARGLARAEEAIDRLSWSWPRGLLRPFATLAAVVLDGDRALVAHAGACRVSRLGPAAPGARLGAGDVRAETVDHVTPPPLPPIATRALGIGGAPPEVRAIAAAPGDRFLLADAHVHRAVDAAAIAACAAPSAARFAAHLRGRLGAAAPHGTACFAIADVLAAADARAGGDDRAAPAAPASCTGPAPPRSWLYAPGEPLPPPPPAWARGAHAAGPDAAWFDEVYGLVCAPPAR